MAEIFRSGSSARSASTPRLRGEAVARHAAGGARPDRAQATLRHAAQRARAKPGLSGDDGERDAVHRPVRNGLGHHERLPRHRCRAARPRSRPTPPGIAEALVATAAGLAAAIPAVIFYNHFLGRLRSMDSRIDEFVADFIHRIQGRQGADGSGQACRSRWNGGSRRRGQRVGKWRRSTSRRWST